MNLLTPIFWAANKTLALIDRALFGDSTTGIYNDGYWIDEPYSTVEDGMPYVSRTLADTSFCPACPAVVVRTWVGRESSRAFLVDREPQHGGTLSLATYPDGLHAIYVTRERRSAYPNQPFYRHHRCNDESV